MVKGVLKNAKGKLQIYQELAYSARDLSLSFIATIFAYSQDSYFSDTIIYFRLMCQVSCRGLTWRPIIICHSVFMGKMQRKTFQLFKESYKSSNRMHL